MTGVQDVCSSDLHESMSLTCLSATCVSHMFVCHIIVCHMFVICLTVTYLFITCLSVTCLSVTRLPVMESQSHCTHAASLCFPVLLSLMGKFDFLFFLSHFSFVAAQTLIFCNIYQ